MKIENIQIEKIKPYEKNAKLHPKSQIEKVANSIKEFGVNQPLVVDKDFNLVVGHGRLEAAKILGLKEVPVFVSDNLTKEQINAYRLADNKLNESDWDMKLVIGELHLLDSLDYDISFTGFDQSFLDNLSVVNDPSGEWVGMPEFTQNDATSFRKLIVHFGSQDNIDVFCGVIGQILTEKTKFIWYPPVPNEKYIDKLYE